MTSKARSMMAWTSSGSSRSDMAVKDWGEAKRSATSIGRSAGFSVGSAGLSGRSIGLSERATGLSADVGAPHEPQNFFPGVSSAPQARHGIASDAPQSSQNFAPARFSAWHFGHFIASLQQVAARAIGEPGRD